MSLTAEAMALVLICDRRWRLERFSHDDIARWGIPSYHDVILVPCSADSMRLKLDKGRALYEGGAYCVASSTGRDIQVCRHVVAWPLMPIFTITVRNVSAL